MLLLPILLPVVGGVFVMRQKTEQTRNRLVLWLLGLTAVCAAAICALPEQTMELLTIQGTLRLTLRTDGLTKFFMALVTVIWIPVSVFSFLYLKHEGKEPRFEGFFLMTLGSLMGLAMAANFVTLYMFFEAMSLISMPLVLHAETAASRRAGFQYLGYSVFGAAVALAGFFILSCYLAVPDFTAGGVLSMVPAEEHRQVLLTVWLLMVLGFGAKAGMMPMQAWLPAAHPVAPAPASAVLSGVITKGGILAIIRVTYYMFGPDFLLGSWAQKLLIALSLLTVFVGSMLALREQLFKKRLAYSTVSQAAYVLFGLMLLTETGVQGALAQMVFHALAKDTLFLAAGAVIMATGFTRVDQLRGIGKRMPVTMWCFTLAALSLVGIPPLGGFVSKWYLATAALQNGDAWVNVLGVGVLILSALLTAGYLLPIISGGFFPGADCKAAPEEVGRQMTVPMVILAALTLGLGLFSAPLLSWLRALTSVLFSGGVL